MTQWPMLNLTAGPVEVAPRTLREMARPVLHFDDPVFVEMYDRTTRMLQEVFRTGHDVVIMHGEAMLGLEAAAASLISPGDKVLNLVSGVFGKWYELFIERHGGEVVELAVPYNEAIDPEDVRRALRSHPGIKYLSIVHSETPSGTVNPLEEICRIARKYEVLTIVDTVSGFGGEPLLVGRLGRRRRLRRTPEVPGRAAGSLVAGGQSGRLAGDGGEEPAADEQLPVYPGLEVDLADPKGDLPLHALDQRYLRPGVRADAGPRDRAGALPGAGRRDRAGLSGRSQGTRFDSLAGAGRGRRALRHGGDPAGWDRNPGAALAGCATTTA